MTLFALFTLLSFFAGIVMWRYGLSQRLLLVFLICAGFTIVYYFFDKI